MQEPNSRRLFLNLPTWPWVPGPYSPYPRLPESGLWRLAGQLHEEGTLRFANDYARVGGRDADFIEIQLERLQALGLVTSEEIDALRPITALLRDTATTVNAGLAIARSVQQSLIEQAAGDVALMFAMIAQNSLRIIRERIDSAPQAKINWLGVLGADLAGAGAGALAGAAVAGVGAVVGGICGALVGSGKAMESMAAAR